MKTKYASIKADKVTVKQELMNKPELINREELIRQECHAVRSLLVVWNLKN
uniref:Uncharacterized protein n=1 Tax=Arion vulgaris TaxID=1028688 RepID=A0A0B7BEQ7_9EUPU